MFIGSKPKDLFPRQNKAAADFYRRQQQKRIQAQGPYLVQRSFRRNEGTTDYATIPEVTLAGDFVISFKFLSSEVASTQNILKFGNFLVRVQTDTEIRVWGDLDFTQASFSVPSLGSTFHDLIISGSVSSPNITLTLDGNLIGTTPANANPNFAGAWSLYEFNLDTFSGILANLKIWDNGTLIRDYPLDDNSDILRNRATVLGGELWNGTASFQTGTTTVVASNIPLGIDYLVSVSGLSAGENFNIYAEGGYKALQNNVPLVVRSTDAAFSGEFRCVDFAENQDGVTISIRQADGYGTLINGNASDWGLFQEQATGEWLGQELWTDGIVGSLAPLTILSDSLGVYSEGLSYLYMNNVGLLNANDGTGFNQVSGSTFVRTSSGAIAVRNMSPSESALNFTPSVKEVLNVA